MLMLLVIVIGYWLLLLVIGYWLLLFILSSYHFNLIHHYYF